MDHDGVDAPSLSGSKVDWSPGAQSRRRQPPSLSASRIISGCARIIWIFRLFLLLLLFALCRKMTTWSTCVLLWCNSGIMPLVLVILLFVVIGVLIGVTATVCHAVSPASEIGHLRGQRRGGVFRRPPAPLGHGKSERRRLLIPWNSNFGGCWRFRCSSRWAGWRRGSTSSIWSRNPALCRDLSDRLNFLLNEQPDKAIDAFIGAVRIDNQTVELHFRPRQPCSAGAAETDRAIRHAPDAGRSRRSFRRAAPASAVRTGAGLSQRPACWIVPRRFRQAARHASTISRSRTCSTSTSRKRTGAKPSISPRPAHEGVLGKGSLNFHCELASADIANSRFDDALVSILAGRSR